MLLSTEVLVKQCGFKDIGIKWKVLLAHRTEQFLPEPGHHRLKVVDGGLHFFCLSEKPFLLRQKGFIHGGEFGVLFTKALYFEVQF